MSRSGEKHAQEYNMIRYIFMALRAIYFQAILLRDPVDIYYLQNTPWLVGGEHGAGSAGVELQPDPLALVVDVLGGVQGTVAGLQ